MSIKEAYKEAGKWKANNGAPCPAVVPEPEDLTRRCFHYHQETVWERFLPQHLSYSSYVWKTSQAVVTFDWTTVGDRGNPPDQDYGGGQFGAVAYTYRISKHEVTNAQYTEFLGQR